MTGESAQLPAPVPLRRNTGFRLLWIGQVLSDTGTSAAFIAYPLLILALTHSAVIAGIVGTVRLVVELLLGLLVEHLSGRWALLAFAAVMAVAAVVCMALPGLRQAEAAEAEAAQPASFAGPAATAG